jgi:antitoxin FitA
MAQILVGELPDTLVKQLEARAERNGRSLEAEVREILAQAVTGDRKAFLERAAAMRARLAEGKHTETLELLREDRDR